MLSAARTASPTRAFAGIPERHASPYTPRTSVSRDRLPSVERTRAGTPGTRAASASRLRAQSSDRLTGARYATATLGKRRKQRWLNDCVLLARTAQHDARVAKALAGASLEVADPVALGNALAEIGIEVRMRSGQRASLG